VLDRFIPLRSSRPFVLAPLSLSLFFFIRAKGSNEEGSLSELLASLFSQLLPLRSALFAHVSAEERERKRELET